MGLTNRRFLSCDNVARNTVVVVLASVMVHRCGDLIKGESQTSKVFGEEDIATGMVENIGVLNGIEKMLENIAVNSVAPVFVAMFLVGFVECGFVSPGDDGVWWSGESKRGEEFGDTSGGVGVVVVAKENPLGEVFEGGELLEMTHLRCFCGADEDVEMGRMLLDLRVGSV